MFKSLSSKLFKGNQAVPSILLLATFTSFGLLIPWLGFYWDDWPVIYLTQTQGIAGFWDFYQYDRPFSAWTYVVFSPILQTNPIAWQIFTVLLRGLTAVFFWAGIRMIWPQKPLQAVWLALLFAVCPVFAQQPVAVAYSQHWICFLLYFCSVYFMLKAQGDNQHFYTFTGLALFLGLIQMLTMEYFLGLELLRPVLLWLYYRERSPDTSARNVFKQVVAGSWIYLAVLIVYVLWRVFFLHLAESDPNDPVFFDTLLKTPIQALMDISQKIVQDFIFLINAWLTSIKPEDIDLYRPFSVAALGIAIFGAIIFWMLLRRVQPGETNEIQDGWHTHAILLGVLAVLLGTLPVWIIDRQISVGPLGSRFSLAAMPGLSLMVVGFLDWLSPRSRQKLIVVCILTGISIHANLHIAKNYQQSWEKQRTFYWHLFWRAPFIQPGTAFISDGEIFRFVGLYSTSMGISSLYPPLEQPEDMPYWFFSYSERLYKIPNEILAGTILEDRIRNYAFRGNSHDAILLNFSPESNRCLHLLSLRDNDDRFVPDSIRRLLSISDFHQIQQQPPANWRPPQSIFGKEPDHGWCYYFEKAELAYQFEDWSGVLRLMDEASEHGLAPLDMQEYLPLLDAYLKTGDTERALKLSIQIKQLSDKVDDQVCNAWFETSETNSDPQFTSALEKIQDRFSCFD